MYIGGPLARSDQAGPPLLIGQEPLHGTTEPVLKLGAWFPARLPYAVPVMGVPKDVATRDRQRLMYPGCLIGWVRLGRKMVSFEDGLKAMRDQEGKKR